MESVEQTEGQTIKQHGEAVWEYTKKLILGNFEEVKVPQWFIDNHKFIVNNLHDWDIIKKYTLFHDVGKTLCLEQDSFGKRHFPNHAEVSKNLWLENFPEEALVGELIGLDMLFHTAKYEDILNLNLNQQTLSTLLLVAFAEINANAQLFGGIDSTSFKIKFKKLDKLGKKFNFEEHIDKYSYLFIRKDLSDSQKVVQSAHVAWEAGKYYKHPSLVVLGVKDEKALKKVMNQLIDLGKQFKIFRDNIFENEITAIISEPVAGQERLYFQKYQLLK